MMGNPLAQTSPRMTQLYAKLAKAGPPPPRPKPVHRHVDHVAEEIQPDDYVSSAAVTPSRDVEPVDVKLVRKAYTITARVINFFLWPLWRYRDIRSFALAHSRGRLKAAAVTARHASCAACPHRVVKDGHEYCKGGNGGRGCGCGNYCLSRLSWKLRLRAWSCPIGRFGKGER